MKIIDRYVLWTFLKNYLISFMVLVGLYVVMDMIFHFDEMANIQRTGGASGVVSVLGVLYEIGDFYFYQMFLFFVHLSGIIPVVAAAFTLIRLSRFNELTAMLAAGTPLLRISAPIIIAGLFLNGFLVLDQELLIPGMIPKLIREHDELGKSSGANYPIRAMQDENKALLIAARYRPPVGKRPASMDHVDVIERDASLQPVARIVASHAVWNEREGNWKLTDGRRVSGLRPGDNPATADCAIFQTSITPDEIALYKSSDVVDLLPAGRINQLIARPESYGKVDLLRVKHWRFTQPLSNFVLLLLAIPCVLVREPNRMKLATLKCVAITGLCLTALFLAHQIAGNPPVNLNPAWIDTWPALWAWLPLFIFAPVAVWLMDRVKT